MENFKDWLPAIAAIAAAIASGFAAMFARRMWMLEKRRDDINVKLVTMVAREEGAGFYIYARGKCDENNTYDYIHYEVSNMNQFPICISCIGFKYPGGEKTVIYNDAYDCRIAGKKQNGVPIYVPAFDAVSFYVQMTPEVKEFLVSEEVVPYVSLTIGEEITGDSTVFDEYVEILRKRVGT